MQTVVTLHISDNLERKNITAAQPASAAVSREPPSLSIIRTHSTLRNKTHHVHKPRTQAQLHRSKVILPPRHNAARIHISAAEELLLRHRSILLVRPAGTDRTVVEQLLDKLDVCQQHATAAVPLQLEGVEHLLFRVFASKHLHESLPLVPDNLNRKKNRANS